MECKKGICHFPRIRPCVQSRSNKPIHTRAASKHFSVINEPIMKTFLSLCNMY